MSKTLTKKEQQNNEDLNGALRKLTLIFTKGKVTPGMNPNCSQKTIPSWYEPETFRRGQQLFSTYSIIIGIAHYYGLMLGLAQTDALLPLLTTGQSATVSRLFTRYMSTLWHVRSWFHSDPFDPRSEAFRSLKVVRGLHRQTADKLNGSSSSQATKDDHLWLSQYAMVGAQFSFMGLLTVFPKEFGFHTFTRADFHSLWHFWRVMGYCLGIEDRFNLCSGGSDGEVAALCRLMYAGSFRLAVAERREPTGERMCRAVCDGMSLVNPLFSYNVLMHYHAPCLRVVDAERDYPLRTFSERFHYQLLKFILGTLCKWKAIVWVMSRLADLALHRRLRTMDVIERALEREFPDTHFAPDARCPLSIRINYSPRR
ncbi:hypothetical protein TYRP_021293 [Tyrophagus putrescentiae]|nr:hypothetical protein TYRP_021293 [Tyrophagus putrescentiae]